MKKKQRVTFSEPVNDGNVVIAMRYFGLDWSESTFHVVSSGYDAIGDYHLVESPDGSVFACTVVGPFGKRQWNPL